MELRLLRYFAAVAEHGTVSEAASVLRISQPSLSRQMKKLEQDVGLQLFTRAGTRNILTSEGREFLGAARAVLAKQAEASQLAQVLAQGQLSSVSLAAPRTTLIDIVAPFVATFRQQDPVPDVSEISIDPDLERSLSEHDLVVTARPASALPTGLPAQTLDLARLPVWAYVPAHHRWAEREAVETADLAQEVIITPSGEFRARELLDAALQLEGTAPLGRVETKHGRVAQALAAAGRGVAVVSDDAHFDLRPLRLHHRGSLLTVGLSVQWRTDHHAAEALHELALRLRSFCGERYGHTLPD
ncbi:LysR family transcriptional regulator [Nesterenkonia pannonica]|uniref:LysR family transcriptional regulator n=1 Tax=Nesterenkonia pannonica TaxID=1548602 RepID=UPI00216470B7|nr:LysR family transcriptional regulator [Nesterenkonia pannonica]